MVRSQRSVFVSKVKEIVWVYTVHPIYEVKVICKLKDREWALLLDCDCHCIKIQLETSVFLFHFSLKQGMFLD